MEGFTAEEASRFTRCTPHQLRYWDKTGLVKPSIQATGGRPGVRRLYSFRDLVALRVIRSLLEEGLSLQRVRAAIQFLRKKVALEEHLSAVKLVTDGQSIYTISQSEGQLVDALKEGQMAFFLALDEAVEKLDARAAHYLYIREEFLSTMRRVGSELERQLDPEARQRLRGSSEGAG